MKLGKYWILRRRRRLQSASLCDGLQRHPKLPTIATKVQLHFVFVEHLLKARSGAPVFASYVEFPRTLSQRRIHLVQIRLRCLYFRIVFHLEIRKVRLTELTQSTLKSTR